MSKFTFIVEDEPIPFSEGIVSKRTVEFDAVSLPDILGEFELFLRGAGFSFNGTLDITQEETFSKELEEVHNQYYFDTERNT